MSEDVSKELIHDTGARRYKLLVGGKLVSAADYVVNGDRISFTHTFTDPMQRGHGYAGDVVAFAIDDVETRTDYKVVPMCWYVAKWFEEHPEKAGLLAG